MIKVLASCWRLACLTLDGCHLGRLQLLAASGVVTGSQLADWFTVAVVGAEYPGSAKRAGSPIVTGVSDPAASADAVRSTSAPRPDWPHSHPESGGVLELQVRHDVGVDKSLISGGLRSRFNRLRLARP